MQLPVSAKRSDDLNRVFGLKAPSQLGAHFAEPVTLALIKAGTDGTGLLVPGYGGFGLERQTRGKPPLDKRVGSFSAPGQGWYGEGIQQILLIGKNACLKAVGVEKSQA
jgi:hypothetical protein